MERSFSVGFDPRQRQSFCDAFVANSGRSTNNRCVEVRHGHGHTGFENRASSRDLNGGGGGFRYPGIDPNRDHGRGTDQSDRRDLEVGPSAGT